MTTINLKKKILDELGDVTEGIKIKNISKRDIKSNLNSELIDEIRNNREGAKKMLDRIRSFSDKLDTLLPKSDDFRNKFFLENKMKTLSEIINAELSIVKFLDDSVKTEVDLRKKLNADEDKKGSNVSIIDLAKAVEMAEKGNKESGT